MALEGKMGTGLILGIESSCDETAAAVVRRGTDVLSNVVASQMRLHAEYGGVVPELASREHLRNIVPVVREAMSNAGVSFAELDAIAVTEGPGLAGALLVGITFAKAMAMGLGKPLIGVNHLEGHIQAVLMESAAREETRPAGPLVALVVSGGHTHLYLAEKLSGLWRYRNVGRTVDDAAGEAFDKVAKLLGLGYPGGPWIDLLAHKGDPRAVEFRFGEIKPRAGGAGTRGSALDFSFSGIKTAVLRYVESHEMRTRAEMRRTALSKMLKDDPNLKPSVALRDAPEIFDRQTLDLLASFQAAVVGNLMRQTFRAAQEYGAHAIVVSGGVAANSELRQRFAAEAAQRGMTVEFPGVAMTTDNAAMIAAAGWGKFLAGQFADKAMGASPQLRLG
ncbi:MAG: tRNA (adenosine(37)-N6)-threonylcarbamoyltransferase complex transferase subunit TsaD [Acidobacteriaceae bacterium]